MTDINSKFLAIMPLGYIKRLPVEIAPVFYKKVQDCVSDIDDPLVAHAAQAFCKETEVLSQSLIDEVVYKDSGVAEAFHRTEQVWQGMRFAIQSYLYCGDESMAKTAEQALEIYDSYRETRLRRTNAADQLRSFVATMEEYFSAETIANSFLAFWLDRLKDEAAKYADIYLKSVERAANRVYFTHQREIVHECFKRLYLTLYVAITELGNENLKQRFAHLDSLIAIFTSVGKARSTRIYNKNHGIEVEDLELPKEELDLLKEDNVLELPIPSVENQEVVAEGVLPVLETSESAFVGFS